VRRPSCEPAVLVDKSAPGFVAVRVAAGPEAGLPGPSLLDVELTSGAQMRITGTVDVAVLSRRLPRLPAASGGHDQICGSVRVWLATGHTTCGATSTARRCLCRRLEGGSTQRSCVCVSWPARAHQSAGVRRPGMYLFAKRLDRGRFISYGLCQPVGYPMMVRRRAASFWPRT